jgi:hypothetical protein
MKLLRNVIALFKGCRKPQTASRIVYALPVASKFRKYYNQDQFFDEVDWSDWTTVIDGFEKQFDKWYFAHMSGGHASYMDLCALCALVEVFSHYQSDKDWHEPKNYKEFLRKLDSVFRKKLHTPISITRCEAGIWKPGKLKDFADVFYAGVRCSLHHHGDLASFAGMSGTGKLAEERSDAGESLCHNYIYPIVVFDPAELKNRLRGWLTTYCADLRTNPGESGVRSLFLLFSNDVEKMGLNLFS